MDSIIIIALNSLQLLEGRCPFLHRIRSGGWTLHKSLKEIETHKRSEAITVLVAAGAVFAAGAAAILTGLAMLHEVVESVNSTLGLLSFAW